MTTDRAARRIGGRAAVLAVAVATLAGGACAHRADDPDAATGAEVGEFAATSEYLAGVADATEGQTFRMSMDMTMEFSGDGDSVETGGTFVTGEVDGNLSSTTMDMGALFDDLPGAPPQGDLTMEMVTDRTTLYLRAPFFATTAASMLDDGATRADLGPLADLAEIDDEWGSIDLSRVSLSQAAGAVGGQSADPGAYLEMAARGTDVHELGTDSIEGAEVRGLGATVTYADMISAQGGDADDLREQLATMFGGMAEGGNAAEVIDAVIDEMFDIGMPVEVWVDGDDRVRRISLDLNMAEIMAGVADQMGRDPADFGVAMVMTMGFSDYGDESIEVEVPEASIDITDEYLAFIEGGGAGTGVGGSPIGSS